MAASPSNPPSPAGRASSMVRSILARPPARWRIRRVSRSLTSVLPSASAIKPQARSDRWPPRSRWESPPQRCHRYGCPRWAHWRRAAVRQYDKKSGDAEQTRTAWVGAPAAQHGVSITARPNGRAGSGTQVGGGKPFDRLRLTDQLDLGDEVCRARTTSTRSAGPPASRSSSR